MRIRKTTLYRTRKLIQHDNRGGNFVNQLGKKRQEHNTTEKKTK